MKERDGNDFFQRVLGHLDGRLSDEEFLLLEEELENSNWARSEYTRLARLDSELRDEEAGIEPGEKLIQLSPAGKPHSTRYINWPIVVMAAMAIGLLALSTFLLSRPGSDGVYTSNSPHPTRGVAVVVAEADAEWGNDKMRTIRPGLPLRPGRISLKRGLAQIDFYGGASVILSGPAELELVSRDEAILHRGRLKADVPPAARGFEIRAAELVLEDLGTSFGLAVTEGEQADLVVFDGEIRVTEKGGQAHSLFGGGATRFEKGLATKKKPSAEAFPGIDEVIAGAGNREQARYAQWQADSLERRKDSRLIAYYDFEGLTTATRRLPNRASHGLGSELDGGIVGARATSGRWGKKMALDFRLEGDRVRFNIPGEWDALTLYAWVRVDALDRGLNSLFLTDYYDPGEIHWQLSRKGALHFAVSPKGVENLKEHNRRFYSDEFWSPNLSGQWFLFATTADRHTGEVSHYVNGKELGFSGGTNQEKPLPVMRIGGADLGNWTDPIWETAIRTLNGRIDEFAIYSAALSAEEIQTIYQQGKP